MIRYALPIIATALLTVFYNTADKVVVGQFANDDNAIGAIASTSFVFSLVSNFLIGMGGGVGVLTAQLYGAKKTERLGRAVNHATMTATGQNFGKGEYKRVRKVFLYGVIQSFTVVLVISMTALIFRRQMAMLFVSSDHAQFEEIVRLASEWSAVMLSLYFTSGILQGISGSVKGMGYSISSLIANIVGTCCVRLIWVFFVFPYPPFNTFQGLSLMYPVSWGALALALGLICIFAFAKLRRIEKEKAAGAAADENTNAEALTVGGACERENACR